MSESYLVRDEDQPHPARPKPKPAVRPQIPPPPIPGTPHIHPIASILALYEEANRQGNCVLTYLPRIAAGACYIYRIDLPERATLSIVPVPGDGWRRAELKGPKNRKVRQPTIEAVDRWLAGHRLSIT
ncbi:MAG: PcfJ domain-containing protein [Lentisphaerae bacterium]|nr:PcfJ domain-containing protein [Lentisphaerota bacterium]